ncbi:hypothetical protein EB796_008442 [Bugula neritina]|uniref:Sulfotransferase domain-containing protein n=1 Tax=Bugula neritina TaxID=10212 RepID=A0A7J7K6M1_BUGNE|nr:hypothetical protein EB796_008442 [Bugula neritina]
MEPNRIAKIDLKKLTLVLICLAVVILMLYAQLHTRKHNKAFIEEHVGAFDKLSAPKAEGYLGCYIPSYWPDKGARIPYRNTVNAKECILYCQASSYMYANFRPVDEFCQCDNDFLTRGLSTLPCGKDSPKAVEVYTAGQITDIKYSLLSKHWRSGSCNCTDSECNTLSCLPTEGMCWVGPRSKLLNVIQDTECKHIAVERFDVKGASSQHCVESLNGFLPANCKPWTVKDSEQHLNRFYKVKLTKGTKKVTVPLNPPKNQKKVLLVTYMRSGSTFTSEFFKGYPNSYYLFEPLRGLIPTKTRTHEELSVNGNLEGRSTDLLADLLRCELDKAPLTSIAFSIRKMNDFLKACSVVEHESRLSCMQAHSSSCLSSDMIAIKVIRAKLQWTRQLLENEKYQLENLKIVYLIRDPRAIINSRLKLRLRSTMTNFETHVKCK